MSGTYDEFEKRFSNAWFSANWAELGAKIEVNSNFTPLVENSVRKDAETLQKELDDLKLDMENINQKQLRLANLSKLYKLAEITETDR